MLINIIFVRYTCINNIIQSVDVKLRFFSLNYVHISLPTAIAKSLSARRKFSRKGESKEIEAPHALLWAPSGY